MERVLQLTAMIVREGNQFVATCPELDIVSQGRTVEQARSNLVEAVEGFLEAASNSEVQRRLNAADMRGPDPDEGLELGPEVVEELLERGRALKDGRSLWVRWKRSRDVCADKSTNKTL